MKYRALADLCNTNGILFGIDALPPGNEKVCVVIERGSAELYSAIDSALDQGSDLTVLLSGRAGVPGGHLAAHVGGPVSIADPDEPLAVAWKVQTTSKMWLDRPRQVRCVETLEQVGRSPVAGRSRIGAGTLTIVGDSAFAEDLRIGSAQPLLERLGWCTSTLAGWQPSNTSISRPAVHQCTNWEPVDNGRELVTEAGIALQNVDPNIWEALHTFRHNGCGSLLLRDLPTGMLGPTPSTPSEPGVKDRISEIVLTAISLALGEPVGYLPEQGGDLIQNILPVAENAEHQISTSSKVELMFHTEAAFHPHRPRFLLLLCLRGDPEAGTTLANLNDICDRLGRRELAVLSEPRFRTRVDESYLDRRSRRFGPSRPVVQPGGRPSLCFDADLMRGTDPEAAATLARIGQAAVDAQHVVYLRAGDLLIVDNRTAVHGRTPFTPRYDGTDRWVQRAFVVGDLTAIGDLDGRVVTTLFR